MARFLKNFQSSKTRNIVIIIAIVFVSVILFAVYRAMYGKQILAGRAEVSIVPEGAELKPGAKGLSKEYLRSLVEEEKRIAEEAIKKGESAIPTFVDTGERDEAIGRRIGVEEYDECYRGCLECCRRLESTSSLLNKWVKDGEISAEAAAELSKLEDKDLSASDYAAELNRLVREGKLTPEQAKRLLEAYRRQKEGVVTLEACAGLLDDLVVMGKLGPADADNLRELEKKAVSVSDYEAALNKLITEEKLMQKDKNSLDVCYKKRVEEAKAAAPRVPAVAVEMPDETVARMLRAGEISKEVADAIESFLKTNPSAADYAAMLNRLIEAGKLTAEKAMELLAAFRKVHGDVQITAKDEEVAALQKAQQEQALRAQIEEMQKRAEEKERREQLAATEAMQQRLQTLQAAIGRQAQTLFTSWNAVPQKFIQGPVEEKKEEEVEAKTGVSGTAAAKAEEKQAPIIKAGSIMFGVLDVSVNSDQPGPVMATIVSGKYKGGKLLGSMTKTPDNERVMLQFNSLTMPEWPDVVSVNAVAINPDTAKTALASDVNHHYLMRYGSLFAANFLQGYAEALQQSGSTDTSKQGETTTQNPFLNTREKIFVGLGAVGEKLNDVLQDQFDRAPTIKVDAGVGIGILFTGSVSLPNE